MADKDKIREIHGRLNAIAPIPGEGDVSPLAMARHLAVQAQWTWALERARPPGDTHPHAIAAMCAEFAAATAMYSLAALGRGSTELDLGLDPAVPEVLHLRTPAQVAAFIRDCWEDGGAIGEFLWEYLGEETHAAVTGLVGEFAAATASPRKDETA